MKNIQYFYFHFSNFYSFFWESNKWGGWKKVLFGGLMNGNGGLGGTAIKGRRALMNL